MNFHELFSSHEQGMAVAGWSLRLRLALLYIKHQHQLINIKGRLMVYLDPKYMMCAVILPLSGLLATFIQVS